MESAIQQQMDYYRARAGEYDQWFYRQGRYDRGAELNGQWFAEAQAVADALDQFRPAGTVLELACGTGIWTERLAPHASELTAVDASPEVLALNRQRLGDDTAATVIYVEADLFAWEPPAARFDVVFFSFWLSHVPPDRFAAFWEKVHRALRPGGRFFLVDSLREPSSTAADHRLPEERAAVTLTRRLNDGREFQIYKVFYDPAELSEYLRAHGWQAADLRQTERYFLYGSGVRRAD